MDNVNLNFYGYGIKKPLAQKDGEDSKIPVGEREAKPEQKPTEPAEILSSLTLSGDYNKIFVKGLSKMPNPKDYLDAASIERIQASMAEFEDAVEKYAQIIEAEFGDSIDPSQKMKIALNAVNALI